MASIAKADAEAESKLSCHRLRRSRHRQEAAGREGRARGAGAGRCAAGAGDCEGRSSDLRSCFFTNAIMGARTSESNTGPSPGLKDVGFRNRCARFLREQVRARTAGGVVMVGKEQRAVVAAAFPDLALLAKCETWADIDGRNLQFHANVTNPSGGSFRFCSLMHPSLRASNMAQRGRVFAEYRNDRAEIEMLRRVTASREAD
jgi:hypothetical protein